LPPGWVWYRDTLFSNNFRALAELSVKSRLITMTGHRAFAEAGGLMAYGTNFFDQYNVRLYM
jgi:hypothetical protein